MALLEKSLDDLMHILLDTPLRPELMAKKEVENEARTKDILKQLGSGYENMTANQAYNEIKTDLDKLYDEAQSTKAQASQVAPQGQPGSAQPQPTAAETAKQTDKGSEVPTRGFTATA